MIIKPSTALRNEYGTISDLAHKEDAPIYITKNGKVVAKLTNPNQSRVETAKPLFGILPEDADIGAARDERLEGDNGSIG